ncbi:Hsp70 family protein [Streptomyces anulatus]|uniref:Hsp70 family protein n=1 Tax=Streptomyces anulatus TaxID=1892 RepID=UPI0033FF7E1D
MPAVGDLLRRLTGGHGAYQGPSPEAVAHGTALQAGVLTGMVKDVMLLDVAPFSIKEVYFQDGGRRAGSLGEVRFTDIEHLEFHL